MWGERRVENTRAEERVRRRESLVVRDVVVEQLVETCCHHLRWSVPRRTDDGDDTQRHDDGKQVRGDPLDECLCRRVAEAVAVELEVRVAQRVGHEQVVFERKERAVLVVHLLDAVGAPGLHGRLCERIELCLREACCGVQVKRVVQSPSAVLLWRRKVERSVVEGGIWHPRA